MGVKLGVDPNMLTMLLYCLKLLKICQTWQTYLLSIKKKVGLQVNEERSKIIHFLEASNQQ